MRIRSFRSFKSSTGPSSGRPSGPGAKPYSSRTRARARAAEDTSHAQVLCTWQKDTEAVISEGEGEGEWRVEM